MEDLKNKLSQFSKDISIFNSYLGGNNEIFLKSIIKTENNDFRCPEKLCYLIPEINFIEDVDQRIKINCKCEKKHEKKLDMFKFRELYHQNDIYSVQCDNYKENNSHNKKADFFCFDCQKFECQECNNKDHTGLNNKILLTNYDTFCHKHKLPLTSFCLKCKINICKKCENEHRGDKFLSFDQIKIDEDSLKIINSHIEKLKEENDLLAKNVSEYISETKHKIDSILFKYAPLKQYFDNMISIMIEIKNSYLKKKNGNLNYQIIKNTKNLIDKNFINISANILLQKKLIEEEIKGNKDVNLDFIKTKGNSIIVSEDKNKIKEEKLRQIQENFSHINIIKLHEKKIIHKARDRINQIGICPDGKIICVSKSGDIFIFDSEGNLLLQNDGKQYNNLCIIDDKNFITCSNKINFLIYNKESNEIQNYYETEEQGFSYLKLIYLNNKNMITCNNNNNIGFWIFQKKWRETQINHDKYNISSILTMKIDENIIQLISAGIYSIKFWNIIENQLQYIDTIHNVSCCNINSLTNLDNDLIICGGISSFYIISLKNRNVVKTINVNYRINSIFSTEKFFITGEENGSLTIYDRNKYSLIKPIPNAHKSGIYAISKMRNNDIITGGEDGRIKIWTY